MKWGHLESDWKHPVLDIWKSNIIKTAMNWLKFAKWLRLLRLQALEIVLWQIKNLFKGKQRTWHSSSFRNWFVELT